MHWIWKINITKQFREIIYTKFRETSYEFREMYWYLKILHTETISRNNLYETSYKFRKFPEMYRYLKIYVTKQFCETLYKKFREISRNLSK
jgi:hypothetical protein